MSAAELEAAIEAQGAKVRTMKEANADKGDVKVEVNKLLELKNQLPEGHPLKPKPKKGKGAKAAPAPAPAPTKKEKTPAAKPASKPAAKPVTKPAAKPAPAEGGLGDVSAYFAQHGVEQMFDSLAKELALTQPADPAAWLAAKFGGSAAAPSQFGTDMLRTGYRSHSCGELRESHIGQQVSLSGWVQAVRDKKHFCFVDLRDRYGITQCVCDNSDSAAAKALYQLSTTFGREWVIQVEGVVRERSNKNLERATGGIEVVPTKLTVLNESLTPPFKIEDETDAGYDARLQYRYLDLRRNPVKEALLLRNRVTIAVREILNGLQFCEVETPYLIKSTPEGARDFVVPCREQQGKFYALPQSPQTFKQLIMVGGMDRYFQIVKCFRDEGTVIAQNRQPEFTQIDCEMSFVKQEDVLNTFEAMMHNVFLKVQGVDLPRPFLRMPFDVALRDYGIDKPDLRFDMKLQDLTTDIQNKAANPFPALDKAEAIIGVCVERPDSMDKAVWEKGFYDKKNLDKLAQIEFVEELFLLAKKKEVGSILVWVKVVDKAAGKFETPVKKNFSAEQLAAWADKFNAPDGSVMVLVAGPNVHLETRMCVGKLRHAFGSQLGLRSNGFAAVWVYDFPLLEWDEDEGRCIAMHHPFTSCKAASQETFMTCDPGGDPSVLEAIRANAYDMVINGQEVGGGSIRITDSDTQRRMFELLGMTPEEYTAQFGFIMEAFKNGAPPHGGLAFGLDRLCTLLGAPQTDPATGELLCGIPQQLDVATGATIRDYIAFPKTKGGGDAMIKTPCHLAPAQLDELKLAVTCEIIQEVGAGADAEGSMESAVSLIAAGRLAEIKSGLEALAKKAPPNPRGKPTDEQKAALQTHAQERGEFEATLTKEEMAACEELELYVRSVKVDKKKKGKKGK